MPEISQKHIKQFVQRPTQNLPMGLTAKIAKLCQSLQQKVPLNNALPNIINTFCDAKIIVCSLLVLLKDLV